MEMKCVHFISKICVACLRVDLERHRRLEGAGRAPSSPGSLVSRTCPRAATGWGPSPRRGRRQDAPVAALTAAFRVPVRLAAGMLSPLGAARRKVRPGGPAASPALVACAPYRQQIDRRCGSASSSAAHPRPRLCLRQRADLQARAARSRQPRQSLSLVRPELVNDSSVAGDRGSAGSRYHVVAVGWRRNVCFDYPWIPPGGFEDFSQVNKKNRRVALLTTMLRRIATLYIIL